MKSGIDELLQTKYKNETKENPIISILIKDRFFPPLDDYSVISQIKHLACYYVTLLPASEKSFTVARMNAILIAIQDNPVMCLKWATKQNFRVLIKNLGWETPTSYKKFQKTDNSEVALRICNHLLSIGKFFSFILYYFFY